MRGFKVCIACLSILTTGSVWAHTGDVYFARETQAIKVDGNLGEWPEDVWRKASYYQEILGKSSGIDDFQAWFAVMWNQDQIFLAARVKDDIHECRWFGTYIGDEDNVGFSFIPEHAPDLWQAALYWRYALSSTGDSVMVAPTGRFARPPGGVTFVAHSVVRNANESETHYEAAVEVPFAVEAGKVYGFGFWAKDDDGFPEGTYGFTPGSLTVPGNGRGDIVFTRNTVDPVHVLGRVSGNREQIQTQVHVHAFQGGTLKGSFLCDAEGRFDLLVLPGEYTLKAYSGRWRSVPRDVRIRTEEAIQDLRLELSEQAGVVKGQVTLEDRTTPVPLAGILALQGSDVRARTYADRQGRYEITDLDPGVYDLVSPVAMGDTIESVRVTMGSVTEAPRDLRATETFSRQPAEDDVFEIMKQVFAYDKVIPFDVEIVERRQIEGYVREKIVFNSTHDERVPGYLALPGSGGPHPCVVTLHGGSYTGKDQADFELLRRRLTSIGYAVLALDAKYFNERHVNGKFGADFRGQGYRRRDATVQTVVDYRRALDYLSTRSEIDTTRIGIYGGSLGTYHGSYLAALEPRIKAFVMRGPGLGHDRWIPTVRIDDPLHYVARIGGIPVILFSGYYDRPWGVQGTLRLLDLLKGPTEIIWYNTTHTVPPALYMDEMLAWLKKHL